jgi:hypothetical protein
MNKRWMVLVSVVVALAGCGFSVYSPVSQNESAEARLRDAIIALDNDEYAKAETVLKGLWKDDKSTRVAGLYATAVLGKGGFVLFDIMKNALKLQTGSGKADGSDIMTQMANNSTVLFGGEITPKRQAYAGRALEILDAAKTQNEAVKFQKCLAAGIYAVPILQSVSEIEARLNEIRQVQASPSFCDGENAIAIQRLGDGISATISKAGEVSAAVAQLEARLTACAGDDAGASANELTTKISNLLTKADQGCEFDAAQSNTIGTVALPTCLNGYVSATTHEAAAGDQRIDGCELMLHCSGGSCLN